MQRLFIYLFCIFLFTSGIFAQAPSREDFLAQREQLRRGKIEAYNLKQKAQHLSNQNQSSDFDVTYYHLNLEIQHFTFAIKGTVSIEAKSTVSDLQEVSIDLASDMTVTDVTGDAAGFTRQGSKLIISLNTPVANGEIFSVKIDYNGLPRRSGLGGYVVDNQNGHPLIWTLSEPHYARTWWPCKDVPGDKADSVDIIVTVPAELFVASNGKLISEVNNGNDTKTYYWQERYPISTYLVSLAITPYVKYNQWFKYSEIDSMEITNYIFSSNLTSAKVGLATLPDMLAFFHDIFGGYPFIEEKYGIAQFGWSGGMEHQTLSSQANFGQVLNVHELAHQWWGDMITLENWEEIWLNEGFASYSEALYFEHAFGHEYYHKYMGGMDWTYSGSIYRTNTTSTSSLFNGIVYDKGAWVLHMLRHVVGDSAFFDILKSYASDARFKYGNATTDGLKSVCETVAGRDLDWFFDAWIYGRSRPQYQYGWTLETNGNSATVNLEVHQVQAEWDIVYPMPIDVTFEGNGRDTTIVVFNNTSFQDFIFSLPFRPTAVTLDKDGWILKEVETLFTSVETAEQLPEKTALLQNYPNPFNAGTTIAFELPQPGDYSLKVYNLAGQLVKSLVKANYAAGTHHINWDGHDNNGRELSSGIYVYQLSGASIKLTRKLVLVK